MSLLESFHAADKKRRYGLQTFVETGCERGDGLAYALTLGFKRCFTCDILPAMAERCRERFAGNDRVVIECMDSLSFIRQLPEDMGPTLWWLDAHQPWSYDNAVADTPQTKFPVMLELELIRRRPGYERDVIMIDDLIVLQGSPRWHVGELCDYFQESSFTFQQLLESMMHTHMAEVDLNQEGVVSFLPRCMP